MATSTPIPEHKVLQPRDPADLDENNWPIFDLRNVEVVSKKGKLVNLLHAGPGNPVTVTGSLQPVEKSLSHLTLPTALKIRTPIIQIKNVTHFAYGAYANGDVDFWAAGQAGWHRIKPAESYVDIFQNMIEAVNVFYFVADCYAGGKKPRWDELFANYAEVHHITPKATAEKFYSHGQFIASRMMKGEEGIAWGHTSFYQHLRKLQPASFGVETPASSARNSSSQPAPSRATPTQNVSSRTASSRAIPSRTSSAQTLKQSTTRGARSLDTIPSKPLRSSRRSRLTDAEEQAEATRSIETRNTQRRGPLLSQVKKQKAKELWKFMQKTVNNSRPSPADVTIERFAHSLHQIYKFENEEQATEFLQCLAPDLIPLMQSRRRRAYEWTNLPIYDDLLEAKPTAATKREMAAVELESRAEPLSEDEQITSAESESSEEEVLDEDQVHHSMSGLRPKSGGTFSGKGASRTGKGKGPRRADVDQQDDEVEVMDINTPSKRKSISEDDSDIHPRKRFTRSQGDHDPELEDLEFEVQQAKSTGLPIRRKVQHNGDKPIPPVIVSEPILSTRPSDPGDIWTCPREGCVHKVYGASENRPLIEEHHLEHDEIFSLVRSEENRTHLPVSNLLKRIREMAETQHGPRLGEMAIGGENPMATIFPPPVMRRV